MQEQLIRNLLDEIQNEKERLIKNFKFIDYVTISANSKKETITLTIKIDNGVLNERTTSL